MATVPVGMGTVPLIVPLRVVAVPDGAPNVIFGALKLLKIGVALLLKKVARPIANCVLLLLEFKALEIGIGVLLRMSEIKVVRLDENPVYHMTSPEAVGITNADPRPRASQVPVLPLTRTGLVSIV